ncbi:hypothetical protein [Bartonella clarridgeiae]|uniref:hypothetical protein n=1 Tax=Bartonella clarridgeiae TaxID=56426 RepID=UPI001FCC430F|nr:hypothetical protein [Bartonella clarridgeiae]
MRFHQPIRPVFLSVSVSTPDDVTTGSIGGAIVTGEVCSTFFSITGSCSVISVV